MVSTAQSSQSQGARETAEAAEPGEGETEDVEISEEVHVPKVIKSPLKPSQTEVDEHEALEHVQYRDWCPHCIAARGIGQQRRSQEEEDTAIPTISVDYGFMGQDD